MTWVSFNFVSGQEETGWDFDIDPSDAWIDGWNCCMHNTSSANPYEEGTKDYWDWNDGYEFARGN